MPAATFGRKGVNAMSAICPYNRSRRCHEWFSRTFAAPIIRGSGTWMKAASVLLGTAAVVGATPANAALTFCNKSHLALKWRTPLARTMRRAQALAVTAVLSHADGSKLHEVDAQRWTT
jgi:hypothetical protein